MTNEIPRDTRLKTLGTPISAQELEESSIQPYHLEKKADSQDSIEQVGQLSTAPQEEPSLSNMYVRGTLILLPQVDWIPRFPQ